MLLFFATIVIVFGNQLLLHEVKLTNNNTFSLFSMHNLLTSQHTVASMIRHPRLPLGAATPLSQSPEPEGATGWY